MSQVTEVDGGTAVIESTNGGRISVTDTDVDMSVPFVEVRGAFLASATHPPASFVTAPTASCAIAVPHLRRAARPHDRSWARS